MKARLVSAKPPELALTLQALRVVAMKHRLHTLRGLRERRRTLGEVAAVTGFPKTSVNNHLKALERDHFVARKEDAGWVYYELTDIGRALAESDRIQVTILLGTSALALALAAAVLAFRARLIAHSPSDEAWIVEPIGVNPEGTGIPRVDLLVLAASLLVIAITTLVVAVVKWRGRRGQQSSPRPTG